MLLLMRRLSKLLRIIGLLVTTAALAACTPSKFAYNNAPELLYWWLDGYVDFSGDQPEQVRSELAQFQRWHRRNELPRYADALNGFAKRMPGEITAEPVCALFDDTRASVERMARQVEPATVALVLTLHPEQIAAMEKKYARSNADFREKWLQGAPAEREKRRLKQLQDEAEIVYGSLGDTQKDVLRQQLAASSQNPQLAYNERVRRQQDLIGVLKKAIAEKPAAPQLRETLHGVVERSLRSPDPTYRAYAQKIQKESCAGFAAIHNSMTAEQRGAGIKRVQKYEADMRELIAKG